MKGAAAMSDRDVRRDRDQQRGWHRGRARSSRGLPQVGGAVSAPSVIGRDAARMLCASAAGTTRSESIRAMNSGGPGQRLR